MLQSFPYDTFFCTINNTYDSLQQTTTILVVINELRSISTNKWFFFRVPKFIFCNILCSDMSIYTYQLQYDYGFTITQILHIFTDLCSSSPSPSSLLSPLWRSHCIYLQYRICLAGIQSSITLIKLKV